MINFYTGFLTAKPQATIEDVIGEYGREYYPTWKYILHYIWHLACNNQHLTHVELDRGWIL